MELISRARVKYLRSLGQKKVRASEGRLLVEGANGVEAAIACGCADELYLSEEALATERGARLRESGVPVSMLDRGDAEKLGETRTPAGIFALARSPLASFGELRWGDRATLLVADGVADPGNFGTLVRSAAALGCDGVVVTAGSVEPTNPKAVRATAGAIFRLPVAPATRADVRAAGFELWVADKAGEPLGAIRGRPPRVALLVGNEPRGVAPDAHAESDRAVAIPLSAGVESLNVAVAAGILLHALGAMAVAS